MNLHCPSCLHDVPLASPLVYTCPQCDGNLEVCYDYEAIAARWSRQALAADSDPTLWRYLPLLPVQGRIDAPPLGGTPCFSSSTLAKDLGIRELWLKNDSVLPSASFKDRASAVALLWAVEQGHDLITAASTGNAGAAAALWSAVLGITAKIFLPRSAPPAKIAQLQTFGAEILLVDGNYDQAFELCLEATRSFGWYNRNTGFNPLTREGKKTAAFEIAEQLNWQLPDYVVVPVGDGNIISGVWKGFVELKALGWIEETPKLLAVQAESSDAIITAWREGTSLKAVAANSVADSINVDLPRDGEAAVRAIQASGGLGIRVSDQQILEAIPRLAQCAGVFAEPAAAASLAGLQSALQQGLISSEQSALLLITGHGLKDIQAVTKILPTPSIIPPELAYIPR